MLNSRQACSLLVNTSLRYDSIPSHNWCYFFMQMTIVSVAVSASRWQTLLLAWHERDVSLTWWWQDNRRSAKGNLLLLGKASFSCSYDVYRPSILFFPTPIPRKAWYTKFYEPARLSTPPKPLFSLNRWTPKPGWGHCCLPPKMVNTSAPPCMCITHVFSQIRIPIPYMEVVNTCVAAKLELSPPPWSKWSGAPLSSCRVPGFEHWL